MLGISVIGWGSLALIVTICLFFYARRARKVYHEHAQGHTPPIMKLIGSGILLVVAAIGFVANSVPIWLHLLRLICLQYAMLLSYSANVWLLTNKPHRLARSKLCLATTVLAVTVVVLGYLTRDNYGLIITDEPFRPTLAYYAHFGLATFIVLYLEILIVGLFWKSLRQAKEVTYIVRRGVGLVAFMAAACCPLLVEISLLLSIFHGDAYRQQLNRLFFIILPMGGLMPVMNVIPQPLLAKAVRPLEAYVDRRRERHRKLLRYLHQRMVQIAPRVQLRDEQTSYVRILVEITHARETIWSHTPRTQAISPKDEATHIFNLLEGGTVIHQSGNHLPPPTRQRDLVKHSLEVAKRLKQLELRASSAQELMHDA